MVGGVASRAWDPMSGIDLVGSNFWDRVCGIEAGTGLAQANRSVWGVLKIDTQ